MSRTGRGTVIARLGGAAILGASLVATGAAPALGGSDPASNVFVTIGSPEVLGVVDGVTTTVTLKLKRNGSIIATKTLETEPSGFFDTRLKPVRIGDRIIIVFEGTRTVTVPEVTLKANPTTDILSGHLPTPGSEADIEVSNSVGSFSLTGGGNFEVLAGPDGDFSVPYPGLSGANRLELRWYNPLNDSFTVEMAVTAVQTRVGSAKAWLFGRPGKTVTAELRAPDGSLRGTARVTLPGTFYSAEATFRRNGTAVKVKAGDRVRIGTTTGLTLRTPDLVVGSTSATATCFPNQDWVIGTVFGAGAFSYLADGTTDGAGALTASWSSPLASGTKVRLMCENAKGWAQDMTGTVP